MAAEGSHRPDESVRAVVAPVVDAAGLYLEDVRVSRAGKRSVVRVTVDLAPDEVGSLDSDRLGEVSRSVSAAMDEADPVRGQYTLEISTPGATRSLTSLRHYRRARTRVVRLQLDEGEHRGRLVDVVDGPQGTELRFEDGATVALDAVRKGTVEVELKRLEDDDDAGSARQGEEG